MRRLILALAMIPCFLFGQSPEDMKNKEARETKAREAREAKERLEHDVKFLKEAGVADDGASLVAFIRKKTISAEDRKRLGELVDQLGDVDFQVREVANKQLRAMGGEAEPILQKALRHPDAEVVSRARALLDLLKSHPPGEMLAAAARMLAHRKPEGAVEALLAYLPDASEAMVEDEFAKSLGVLGITEGKLHPALEKAVTDKLVSKRLAAAAALANGGEAFRGAARKMLADESPRVRMFTAQTLLAQGDKSAVAGLISLLEEDMAAFAGPAEDILFQLAGDRKPPTPPTANSPENRKKYRAAWATWWEEHEPKTDLAKMPLADRLVGLTGFATMDNGTVGELGKDGVVKTKIMGLASPSDVQWLPGNKFLIAEHGGNKVTERNAEGKILWQHAVPNSPVSARRLKNGNTFIATYSEIREVDRDGKVLYSFTPNAGNIYGASKTAKGTAVYVTSNGKIGEVDRTGKETRVITQNLQGTNYWASVEQLPNGNHLVALGSAHKAVEIDDKGKVVWECPCQAIGYATRLSNGNTLVCSIDQGYVAEFDRNSKEVWKQKTGGRTFRTYRR